MMVARCEDNHRHDPQYCHIINICWDSAVTEIHGTKRTVQKLSTAPLWGNREYFTNFDACSYVAIG